MKQNYESNIKFQILSSNFVIVSLYVLIQQIGVHN